jgi:ubiquitin conjugation factor E4 B
MLRLFELRVNQHKQAYEKLQCTIHAIEGALLDEVMQARSMQFMRYVIVWLIRVASPGCKYPKQPLELPLPETPSDTFACLPEYLLDDIVGNFKFITRNIPHIITSTQSTELVTICVTFLRNSEYIKNPYLKAGLVTILFFGVWSPYQGRKGVLYDVLFGSDFCMKYLLHSLMKFYIEAESTGGHTQFFDKFNMRYEIFEVIKAVWSNPVYRQNLEMESK